MESGARCAPESHGDRCDSVDGLVIGVGVRCAEALDLQPHGQALGQRSEWRQSNDQNLWMALGGVT